MPGLLLLPYLTDSLGIGSLLAGMIIFLPKAWVVLVFLVCATAYSVFQVPYVALPAEMTDDYAIRTQLVTWRVAILAVAILLSGATAPLIRNAVGGAAGYRAMAVFVAVLIMVGTLGAFLGTVASAPRRPLRPSAAYAGSWSWPRRSGISGCW